MRSRKLPGMPILTLDSGANVGRIKEPIIDAENHRVAAFFAATGRFVKRLLPIESVHAFGSHAVTVRSQDALLPLKSPGSLESLLQKKRIPLLGTPVVTRLGDFAGTVRDFEIDGRGKITALCVADGLFKSLSGQETSLPGELMEMEAETLSMAIQLSTPAPL